jgi:hypothetical protein
MVSKELELETQISLCICGNKDLRINEHGLGYCSIDEEHNCPFRDKVKYLKAYESIVLEYHLCQRWKNEK